MLLENYTAVLAQEVTAPLETIRRYLRFMRTDQQTTLSHSSRDAMDAITNILDTLKNSTQFLADCTTLENFAQAVPCPLTTTIETALENLACKAHGSKLSFSYGDLPMIRMNRWKCLLIIQNLFDLMMNIAASGTPAEVEVEANIRGERGILSLSAPKQLFDPASLKTLYWLQSAPYFESGFHEYSMEFAPFMLVRAVATYCRDELHISEEEDQLLIRYHFPVNR
jgi:light-regulated signal transduction histidine kinase (bacteriophytochrome)